MVQTKVWHGAIQISTTVIGVREEPSWGTVMAMNPRAFNLDRRTISTSRHISATLFMFHCEVNTTEFNFN